MNLAELIQAAAARHNLPTNWLRAIVGQESGGNPNVLSPKGAMGLGQLMPGTAREMGVTNPWDPAQNIEGSAGYLEKMQAMFHGDRTLATAAYNWGPGNLQKQGLQNAPAETRNYLARIAQLSNDPGLATSQVMQGQMPNGIQAAPQPALNPPAPPAPEPMQNTSQELAAGQPPPAVANNTLGSLIADVQKATPGVSQTGVVGQRVASTPNAAGWAADLTLDDIRGRYTGKLWPPEVFERFKQLTTPGLMQPTTPAAPPPPPPKRPPTSDLIS